MKDIDKETELIESIEADIKGKPEQYLEIHQCQKCQHKWSNRNPRKPRICPKCKTVNWEAGQ